MNGHQGDLFARRVIHVLVGEQGCLGQEVADLATLIAAFLLHLLEIVHSVHQLVKVLDAADVLGCVVAKQHTLDLCALHRFLCHGERVGAALVHLDETFHQCGESV